MKNIFKILLATVVILAGVLPVFASGEHVHYAEDITVEFDENTEFSEIQKQNIIDHFTGKDSKYMINSILCVFGHNLTTERTYNTRHRVYTSSPRCEKDTYDVSSCSRCDYVNSEYVTSDRVYLLLMKF